jgi:hypothetical protein
MVSEGDQRREVELGEGIVIEVSANGILTCTKCNVKWHGCLYFRVGPKGTLRINPDLLPDGWSLTRFVPGC